MFHEHFIEPNKVYFELISHYKKLFFSQDYGLAIVQQNTLININPTLSKLLGCDFCQQPLGQGISAFIKELQHQNLYQLKTPVDTFSPQVFKWCTQDGQIFSLSTFVLQFNIKQNDFFLLLTPRDASLIAPLKLVARQLLLMLQSDYRPILVFDSHNLTTQPPYALNVAASSYFGLSAAHPLILDNWIHEQDKNALQSFAQSSSNHKSTRSHLTLVNEDQLPLAITLQSYPIVCNDHGLILSFVSNDLMHLVQETKSQFNYQSVQDFFNFTKKAMLIVDKNMVVRELNIGFIQQFKYAEDDMIGKDVNNFFANSILNDKIQSSDTPSQVSLLDAYGTSHKLSVYDIPIYLEDEFIGKYLLFSEANSPKPAELKHLHQQLFNLTPEQILLFDENLEVCWTSGSFSSISEFPNDAILKQDISAYIAKESQQKFKDAMAALSGELSDWYGPLWFKIPQEKQRLRSVHLSKLSLSSKEGVHYVMTLNHIQTDREMEQLMTHFAFQDPFLEVPNHLYSERLIADWIYECGAHHKHFSVLKLSFTGLAALTELKGPNADNELLQTLIDSLLELLNPQSKITRASDGGLLICHKGLKSKKQRLHISHSLLREIRYHLEKLGLDELITCHCGMATFPNDGLNFAALLEAVEASLLSHQTEDSELSRYEQMLQTGPKKEGMIIRYLQEGLHKGEFSIVYQPLIDLKTKKVTGIETLLRWENADVGNIPPKEFIPLAEKSNLIVKIGYFVIGETVRKLHHLRQNGHTLTSSVNISLKQLEVAEFAEKIMNIMNDYDLPPEAIEFEITESITASLHPTVLKNIKTLTDFGLTFNVDDFGTGYSSLKQMKHLKIKGLKIDHSLIQDMAEDTGDLSLVKAISAMAKNIGLKLIAEGVETREQLEALEKIGFEEAQGFLFSVPLVDKDIEKFIEETNGKLKL